MQMKGDARLTAGLYWHCWIRSNFVANAVHIQLMYILTGPAKICNSQILSTKIGTKIKSEAIK